MSRNLRLTALAQAIGADVKSLTASILTHSIEPYVLSANGVVTVKVGTSKIVMENACVVDTVRAYVTTAPAGGPLKIDINKNGSTIYGTQTNQPTIATGANSALGGPASGAMFAAGDVLSVDVDSVGSTTPGSDLTVTVRMRRTS